MGPVEQHCAHSSVARQTVSGQQMLLAASLCLNKEKEGWWSQDSGSEALRAQGSQAICSILQTQFFPVYKMVTKIISSPDSVGIR